MRLLLVVDIFLFFWNRRVACLGGESVCAQPMGGLRPRYGLFVPGIVRGESCRVLVDSGCTDTLISSRIYYVIDKAKRPVLEAEWSSIQQVDGSPLAVIGVAWVDVQIGGTAYPIRAIFADIKYDGILGMDFLLPTCGELDFRNLELRLNGEKTKCTSSTGESFVGRVLVAETAEIQAGHEAIVPGKVATTL